MKIEASSLALMKPEMVELLKKLKAGDTLKGRVVEVLDSSISIRTAGGQVFTAMLQEGAGIAKGSLIELIVKYISDGKVFAELKEESKTEGKVSGLLKQVGLPVDDKNMEAARLLIKYKLPLSRDNITDVVNMQKYVENLNQSGSERVGLLLSGLDIENTPVDVLNKIILQWPEEPAENTADENAQTVRPDVLNEAEGQQDNISGKSIPAERSSEAGKPEALFQDEARIEDSKAVKGANAETVESGEAAVKKEISGTPDNISYKKDSINESVLVKALEKLGLAEDSEIIEFARRIDDILASIKGTDAEAITFLMSKEMDVTPNNLKMLLRNIEGNDDISRLLDELQQRIDAYESSEFKEIKESIRKLFLEPVQLEENEEISEQIKEMARLGEKLESLLKKDSIDDPKIREVLTNIKDNIEFIKNINQYSNYYQIPLLINSNTTTGKLYVFKEGKRGRRINPEDATVVISLDLINLGHLESLIRIKGRSVDVTFGVERRTTGAVIEKHSSMLRSMLQKKDYRLNSLRVINLEQRFSLLSLEAATGEKGMEKIHFDMRV